MINFVTFMRVLVFFCETHVRLAQTLRTILMLRMLEMAFPGFKFKNFPGEDFMAGSAPDNLVYTKTSRHSDSFPLTRKSTQAAHSLTINSYRQLIFDENVASVDNSGEYSYRVLHH